MSDRDNPHLEWWNSKQNVRKDLICRPLIWWKSGNFFYHKYIFPPSKPFLKVCWHYHCNVWRSQGMKHLTLVFIGVYWGLWIRWYCLLRSALMSCSICTHTCQGAHSLITLLLLPWFYANGEYQCSGHLHAHQESSFGVMVPSSLFLVEESQVCIRIAHWSYSVLHMWPQ